MSTTERVLRRLPLVGFLAIAAFFLLTEHRAHLFGVLPFLLLLACPFLHVFGHRGHGGHESVDDRSPDVGGSGRDAHGGHNLPRGRAS